MHTHTWVRANTHGYTSTGAYMQIPRCEDYRTLTPTACIVCGWRSVLLAGIHTGLMTVSHVFVHRHGLDPVLHGSHRSQYLFMPTGDTQQPCTHLKHTGV